MGVPITVAIRPAHAPSRDAKNDRRVISLDFCARQAAHSSFCNGHLNSCVIVTSEKVFWSRGLNSVALPASIQALGIPPKINNDQIMTLQCICPQSMTV